MASPLQERSRRSLDRMLAALEGLLAERPFEKITIADLASRADVAVGSIYARFADKQALLVGMHRRIHEKSEPCRRRLVDPVTWEGRDLEAIARGVVLTAIQYYRQHGPVLRAVAINLPPDLAAAVKEEIAAFNAGMCDLVSSKAPHADRQVVEQAVGGALRTVVSVLVARVMHNPIDAVIGGTDRQVARELETIIRAFLEPVRRTEADPKSKKGTPRGRRPSAR